MFTCFLKRVLPFMLTLLVGSALGSIFSASTSPRTASGPSYAPRAEQSFTFQSGRGCRNGRKNYVVQTIASIDSKPEPRYTDAARRNGVTGTVRLLVTLGADGHVTKVETVESLPYGLTESAREAARAIQFTPAMRNGLPIDETREVAFYFSPE
jgi:TonB family protein